MQVDIRTMQMRTLPILLAVHQVCQEHGLRYYLCAGTLLGAVRHRGFIPWDDDMDIAMPRKDYDIFMSHAKEWLPKEYEAQCFEIDHTSPGAFGKICDNSTVVIEKNFTEYVHGIYLDVFPLDGMPDEVWRQKWQIRKYKMLFKLIYFLNRNPYKHGNGLNAWFTLCCHKILPKEWIQKKIRSVQMQYDFETSRHAMDYDDKNIRGVLKREIFGEPTDIQFEGYTLKGVAQPDVYLRQKYGDYMQIPSEDKRRQHGHLFVDLNMSVEEYLKTKAKRG